MAFLIDVHEESLNKQCQPKTNTCTSVVSQARSVWLVKLVLVRKTGKG